MKADLDCTIGDRATISFRMRPNAAYHNGENRERVRHDLLKIPGLVECFFLQTNSMCSLNWRWQGVENVDHMVVNLPELPGPEWYFLQYTWDAKAGRFDGYVNGNPLRIPGTEVPPWTMPSAEEIVRADGPFQVEGLTVTPTYTPEAEARKQVPAELRDRHAGLFGIVAEREPLDVAKRLGETLYRSPLDSRESVSDWIMEGPGILKFEDGWMEMASERPEGPEGHNVIWCPQDFPGSFVAEWAIRPVSEYGLCIVFFAAKGEHGEDIFDESLPERNSVFSQYTKGAINSYHISYYANTPFNPGRITSNIRKNNRFYLVSNGPPGIPPGSQAAHHVRLIKDGAHIQLLVDGRVIIDWTDAGERYGPVYGGGKIGLRQMQWMVAKYRNFSVRRLKD